MKIGMLRKEILKLNDKESNYQEVLDLLNRHRATSLSCDSIEIEKGVAKVSVVGAGMISNPGVAAKMFEALYSAGINIKMISTSEIRVTVLIDEAYTEKAMNAVHDAFGLSEILM